MLAASRRLCMPMLLLGLLIACDGGSGLAPEPAVGGTPGSTTNQIRLRLFLQPNGPTDVEFKMTGDKKATARLDDDDDPTLSNLRVFPSLKPGTYTITMGPAAPYTLTEISCTIDQNGGGGGSNTFFNLPGRSVTIQLAALDVVSCTFVGTIPANP
jgi:hypothetical protein